MIQRYFEYSQREVTVLDTEDLGELIGEDEGVALARQISSMGADALASIQRRLSAGASAEERTQLLVLLTYFKEPEAAAIALKMLESPTVTQAEKRWIAGVMLRHPSERALAALESLSGDEDESVRSAVIRALPMQVRIDRHRVHVALTRISKLDPSPSCRDAALRALETR